MGFSSRLVASKLQFRHRHRHITPESSSLVVGKSGFSIDRATPASAIGIILRNAAKEKRKVPLILRAHSTSPEAVAAAAATKMVKAIRIHELGGPEACLSLFICNS